MSYDKPNRIAYHFPSLDWGNSVSENFGINGPKGKKGRLYDYGVIGATEAFTSASITIAIGTAANPDAYGEEFTLNGCADAASRTVRSTYDEIADATAFNALMVDRNLPADTTIQVTMTGAAAAGIGTPFVVIDWDN